MNLLKKLESEIEESYQNATTIDKIFLIYTRLCEQFQYDSRWDWSRKENNKEVQNEVFNQEIDITNAEKIKAVCSGFAKAYCDLSNTLLIFDENYDISLTEGSLSHVYASTVLRDGTTIKIDPFMTTTSISDSLNVKKEILPGGIEVHNSPDYNDDYLKEKSLHTINYPCNNLYIKFLHLVKEELLRNEECTPEKMNELFQFFKETSNFNNLGLKEVHELFFLTTKETTNRMPHDLNVKKMVLYDSKNQETKYLYQVPKDSENVEYYIAEEKDKNIIWNQIEEPIDEYINQYDNQNSKKYFLTKQSK